MTKERVENTLDREKLTKAMNGCIEWIKEFFEKNGKGCNAVLGISGGKDSSVVAALCVEALGKDRVIGLSACLCQTVSRRISIWRIFWSSTSE